MTERKEAVRAERRVCTVPGCYRTHVARGYCKKHYLRWSRNGDPLGGRSTPGEQHRYFREVVIPYKGDDCLIWPYSRTKRGYGGINFKGEKMEVHRLACIEVHGPPQGERYMAAHSCGNGHLGCCNPKHLRWATPAENGMDKRRQNDALWHRTTTRPRNSSGIQGVSWNALRRCWQVFIRIDGKNKNLGTYRDIQQAEVAYRVAAKLVRGPLSRKAGQ